MHLEQNLKDLADVIYHTTIVEVTSEIKSKTDKVLAKQGSFREILNLHKDAVAKLTMKRVESYTEVYKDSETLKLDLDDILY